MFAPSRLTTFQLRKMRIYHATGGPITPMLESFSQNNQAPMSTVNHEDFALLELIMKSMNARSFPGMCLRWG